MKTMIDEFPLVLDESTPPLTDSVKETISKFHQLTGFDPPVQNDPEGRLCDYTGSVGGVGYAFNKDIDDPRERWDIDHNG